MSPNAAKTMTVVSLLGYSALVHQQADDFALTLPIRPVLHAELAYTGGTVAIGTRGFASSPPNGQIELQNRRTFGGSLSY